MSQSKQQYHSEIKPIKTEYKGVVFRSRLEARWAVFFDHINIIWRYEFEGYDIGNKYYLPDFYLPEYDLYCEVKPFLEEVIANEPIYLGLCKGRIALLMLIGEPNVNVTKLFYQGESNNVVPFVNNIIKRYGNFFSSTYEIGSNEDKWEDYVLFNEAIKSSTKYIFY